MPTLISQNPYTEEVNATIETISEVQLLGKIDAAHTAYLSWKHTSSARKKELFLKLADALEGDIDACARLETIEMGMLNHISRA